MLRARRYVFATFLSMAIGTHCLAEEQEQLRCQESISISKPDSLYVDNFDGSVTDSVTGLIWKKCSLGYEWNAHDEQDSSDDSCDLAKKSATPHYDWQTAVDVVAVLNVDIEADEAISSKVEDSEAQPEEQEPKPNANNLASSLAADIKKDLEDSQTSTMAVQSDTEQALWRLPEVDELMSLIEIACVNPSINATVFPSTDNTLYWTATEVENDEADLVYFSYASQISLDKQRRYAVRAVKSGQPLAAVAVTVETAPTKLVKSESAE